MANTKTALKQWRVSLRKRARNRSAMRTVRTVVKTARTEVGHKTEDAATAVTAAVRALDKAAQKKLIHRNNAARRKSRLMKHLNAALTTAS